MDDEIDWNKSNVRKWNKKIEQLILEVMREETPIGDWDWEMIDLLVNKIKKFKRGTK